MRVLALLLGGLAAACRPAAVNKPVVRPPVDAIESSRVGLVRVPYDPSQPYYLLTIEPFTFDGDASSTAPDVRHGWGPSGWGLLPDDPRAQARDQPPAGASGQMGNAIANQLVTVLGNTGNIRILDYEYYWRRRDKPATLVRRNAGEVGPFVIRGSVTEFNEIAETTGAALHPANTKSRRAVARRTGSVAIDLNIVDPTNGQVAATINANGSFTNESATNGFSLFRFGKASNAFAASALGQANRIAMNSAAQQVSERLSRLR